MSIENPNNLYSEEEAFEEANKMRKLIDEGKASNYDEAEKIINQENEAFEEANKMSEKIESGEAKDYNEAEKLVEEENKKKTEEKEKKIEAEKIKIHFQDELKKIEDLPQKTEVQKIRKANLAAQLIEHWLPFGYLDNFQGIDRLMEIIEESDSKIRFYSPLTREKIAQKVAYEMAFQYKLSNEDDQTKIDTIISFVNKWLKDKSVFYRAADNFKEFFEVFSNSSSEDNSELNHSPEESTPETSNQENENDNKSNKFNKLADNAIDKIEKITDKVIIWASDTISKGLKSLGSKDKTLARVGEILASYVGEDLEGKIPYTGVIDQIISNIDNNNIKFNATTRIKEIEEWTDQSKFKNWSYLKLGLGTLPTMPLKQEFLIKLFEEKSENLTPEEKAIAVEILEQAKDRMKNKELKEQIEKIQNKLKEIKKQENSQPTPEAVKNAEELIKKEEGKGKESLFKKAGGWETILSIGGFSLIMFLLLIFIGEFKIWEKATGWNLDIGGGKGKK